MKRIKVSAVTFLFALLALTPAVRAQCSAYTFQSFDFPHSNTVSVMGTKGQGVNDSGEVTGLYWNDNGDTHGFVRSARGKFTSFDCSSPGQQATSAYGINNNGQVSGSYVDADDNLHGFVRSADGSHFTTFDTSAGPYTYTNAFGINKNGEVAGWYSAQNMCGFVRSPGGSFTDICDPSAVWGTSAMGINNNDQVTGYYTDANLVSHGFVGSVNGPFATFDDPYASSDKWSGTAPYGINDSGQISGYYSQGVGGGTTHGFVRSADGSTFTTIDYPSSYGTTKVQGINNSGQVTGYYLNNGNHGFIATPAPAYSISGSVKDGGGNPLQGVRMALTGASSATAPTAGNGTYSFPCLLKGSYTVKSSMTGYAFKPISTKVAIANKNIYCNFTGAIISISGKVAPYKGKKLGTLGQDGITINLSGAAAETTATNGSGNFIFSALANGVYTVTPVAPAPSVQNHPALFFSPPSAKLSILGKSGKPLSFAYKANSSCAKCH
ncbi:MAG: carboxypeptidase regulatory-like domain-containing protein [Syntrophobacteraceae bacterium]